MTSPKPIKEQIREYLNRSGVQLPVFNPVALELNAALGNEDASPAKVEAMICKDPALAGQVLRMANSSAFAGLTQIVTVRQALMRLGMKQVARLAIAASQHSLYRSQDSIASDWLARLWRQAYASATGASWIAECTGRRHAAESAFLAGLLHDIGKLLILRAIEDLTAHGDAEKTQITPELLLEVLDSLHCEMGFELMQHWNLPEAYCLVGRDHHAERFDSTQELLVIVRLLDQVCAKLGIGGTPDPEMMPAASTEAQALGLSEVQIAELEIFLEDGAAFA